MRVNYYFVTFAILLVGHSYCLPIALVQSLPLIGSNDHWVQFNGLGDSSAATLTVSNERVWSSHKASGEKARPLKRRQSLLSSLGVGGPTTTNAPVDSSQEFSPNFGAPKLSLISLKKRNSEVGQLMSSNEAWGNQARPLQRRQSLLSSLGLGGPSTTNAPVHSTQEFSPNFDAPKLSLISLKKRHSQRGELMSTHEASGESVRPLQRRQSLLSSLGVGGPTTTNSPVHKTQDFSPDFGMPQLSLVSLKKRESQLGEL